jgi:Amiloride-sensitive sodium channel
VKDILSHFKALSYDGEEGQLFLKILESFFDSLHQIFEQSTEHCRKVRHFKLWFLVVILLCVCRAFWIFFMLLGLVLFFGLIFMTTSRFLEGKIILKLASEETCIKGIPFPALTVCSEFYHVEDLPRFYDTLTTDEK